MRPVALLAVAALIVAGGCADEPGTAASPSAGPSTTLSGNVPGLEAFVRDHVAGRYDELATAAAALATATDHCSDTTALQQAWRDARLAWDRAAIYRFDVQINAHVAAAVDYWPVNIDQLDAALDGDAVFTTDELEALGSGARGLPSIEAVIFGGDVNATRSCTYVREAAASIERDASAMADAFVAAAPDIAGNDPIASVLGVLADASYWLADQLIDMPAGSRTGGVPDPSLIQAGKGGMAVDDIRAQLDEIDVAYDATVRVLLGERFGELPDQFGSIVEQARQYLDALDGDLGAALVAHPDVVGNASASLRELQRELAARDAALLGVTLHVTFGDGD